MKFENFVTRGMKAQAAFDEIISKHNSPATTGASPSTASAGELANTRPRTPDILTRIGTSTDTAWLKAVMGSQDYQVSIRSAAQRRLAKLFKKKPQARISR